jgi:hypothetical protein
LTILGAMASPTPRTLSITLVTWVALALFIPLDFVQPHTTAVLALLPQAALIALPLIVLWRLKPAASPSAIGPVEAGPVLPIRAEPKHP